MGVAGSCRRSWGKKRWAGVDSTHIIFYILLDLVVMDYYLWRWMTKISETLLVKILILREILIIVFSYRATTRSRSDVIKVLSKKGGGNSKAQSILGSWSVQSLLAVHPFNTRSEKCGRHLGTVVRLTLHCLTGAMKSQRIKTITVREILSWLSLEMFSANFIHRGLRGHMFGCFQTFRIRLTVIENILISQFRRCMIKHTHSMVIWNHYYTNRK